MPFGIPVEVDSEGVPYVTATVHWRKRRTSAAIRFLLDTGAYDIALSADDAEKLGAALDDLPVSRWPIGGIGGEVESYDLPGVSVGFADSSGRRLELRIRTVRVMGYPKGEYSADRRPYVPSLLGRAFLKRGRFVLLHDFELGAARLEMKDASASR